MKFEQALKAMRRGETVRRKVPYGALFRVGESGSVLRRSQSKADWEECSAEFSMDSILKQTDWVIVRKKKKLRDVFKDPKVGDVIGDSYGQWAVIDVDSENVRYWAFNTRCVREQFRSHWAIESTMEVLHRAEDTKLAMKEMGC